MIVDFGVRGSGVIGDQLIVMRLLIRVASESTVDCRRPSLCMYQSALALDPTRLLRACGGMGLVQMIEEGVVCDSNHGRNGQTCIV